MKFCYDDSFDTLISSLTVLCSGLIFSLLHITFRASSLALPIIKSRKMFLSASFIQSTWKTFSLPQQNTANARAVFGW